MTQDSKLFDDLAKLASGALGTMAGLRHEMEAQFRERLQRLLADADLVPREEFEAVKEMAAKAREEQERLVARVAANGTARGGDACAAGARTGERGVARDLRRS